VPADYHAACTELRGLAARLDVASPASVHRADKADDEARYHRDQARHRELRERQRFEAEQVAQRCDHQRRYLRDGRTRDGYVEEPQPAGVAVRRAAQGECDAELGQSEHEERGGLPRAAGRLDPESSGERDGREQRAGPGDPPPQSGTEDLLVGRARGTPHGARVAGFGADGDRAGRG